MPNAPTIGGDEDLDAQILLKWLATSPDAASLRQRLRTHPDPQTAITAWVYDHASQAPPQIANYVHGGRVDRLVNIAHVDQLVQIGDPGPLFWATGLARVLIVVGIFVALAGFASFGYPIVRTIANVGSDQAARNRCNELFPPDQRGPSWLTCMERADRTAEIDATPWIPLGAGLFLAGATLITAGAVMVRQKPNRPSARAY
jgi:hypothetical protein